jgi:hypothetical protein
MRDHGLAGLRFAGLRESLLSPCLCILSPAGIGLAYLTGVNAFPDSGHSLERVALRFVVGKNTLCSIGGSRKSEGNTSPRRGLSTAATNIGGSGV